ncbi:hypothetical protein ACOME3_003491 [Neoechinorhynchus agilis]
MNEPFISAEPSTVKNDPRFPAHVGLIGLAVMGQNLVLNLADHGFKVIVYNRTLEKTETFVTKTVKDHSKIFGAYDLPSFIASLSKPRRIILLVKAGSAVDAFIDKLVPLLEPSDVIIDGGNSLYLDTNRRALSLAEKNIHFVGMGVSGGENGARYGPSMMPGGSREAWEIIKEPMMAISAKAPEDGLPCCTWIGIQGAGHFVKMVHNGIEYADMQLICEAYDILKTVLKLPMKELAEIFDCYNRTELNSYLIEITKDVLAFVDDDGTPLLPKIRDRAGQKGTGKWTVNASLDLFVPLTVVAEAVQARCLSGLTEQRSLAHKYLKGPAVPSILSTESHDPRALVEHVRRALYISKIVSYAQGFMLMSEASKSYNWNLDFGSIAQIWRAGCIIRSGFLNDIKRAYDKQPQLANLLIDPYFSGEIEKYQESWRLVISTAILRGIPVPCFSSSLAFFDALRADQLPANLIQAMRDYFGAHTYELTAEPDVFRHTNWTGEGGNITATTYDA